MALESEDQGCLQRGKRARAVLGTAWSASGTREGVEGTKGTCHGGWGQRADVMEAGT